MDVITEQELGKLEARIKGDKAGTVLPIVRCVACRAAAPPAALAACAAACTVYARDVIMERARVAAACFPQCFLHTRNIDRSPHRTALRCSPSNRLRFSLSLSLTLALAQDRDSIDQSFGSREGFPSVAKPRTTPNEDSSSSASAFPARVNRRKGTPKKKVQRRAPSAEKKSNKRARTGPAPTPAAKEAAATDEAASSSSPHKSSSAAESMGSAAATAAAAAAKPKNSIRGYFGGPAESPPTAASATSGVAALAGPTPRGRMFRRPSGAGVSAEELASAGSGGLCAADADSMRIDLGAAQKELAVEKSRAEAATKHADFLRQQLVILQDDLHGEREQRKVRTRKASMAIADILRVSMEEEMVEVRRAINADQFRLGRIVRVRKGHGAMEVWRDGQALKDLAREAKELEVRKERVEKRRKEIAKIARKAKADAKKAGASASGSASGAGGGGEKLNGMDAAALELLDSEETVKMQIASRKREETELAEKRRVLESEKRVYLRQLKRVRDEDSESLSRSVLARSSLPLSLLFVC